MSLKLIHTGDVHIGAKFEKLGEKGRDQRDQIKKTFEKIVDYAIENKVNAFLIAGDLFDTANPSLYSVTFVKGLLKKLNDAGIYVFVLPGTHDRLETGSVYDNDDFSDCGKRIIVFNDTSRNSYYIQELDACFYANPNVSNKSTKSPIRDFNLDENSKLHIAMAHGSLQIPGKSSEDDYPITVEEIEKSKMNYIALAHWHNTLDVSTKNTTSYYCGSPEQVAMDQQGAGNILLINIDDTVQVEKVKVGERYVKNFSLDVGSISSFSELVGNISKVKDKNAILNLELVGFWNQLVGYSPVELIESLDDSFFFVNLSDETSISPESYDDNKYPNDYVIGRFINIVKDLDIDEKGKSEVLKYGVSLLEGKNIL